ncbi:hypothetical protein ALC57_05887 [Trachymyrmex cornetzi]|uniref:DUF4218 domain-containing protein n=1 Tax=Trachymyrmex cornetzi TaxID=471704 RepID=A0A151J9L8_9HYME|nr:hypothetical protein ALC57_05887 [Trachymyrmex cornetzi]
MILLHLSHFATWCKTLNVPITHVNAVLLKDIRKHKCFKSVFPSDVRTLLGTPRSTPLKIVYDSCLKCSIHGKYVKNRVCFPGISAHLKTATDFQNNDNILQFVPYLDLVSDVVLDYMHVICLGVTKKLLNLWTSGNSYYKLGQESKRKISDRLENLINICISIEFPRKPRSLQDLKYYKATEFRQLLLCTGPIAFQGFFDNDIYLNFLILHVSIRILCMEDASEEMINYADELLKNFNKTFTILYGEENVSFNVHALLHLANDVHKHGPLDYFSVFRFENFLQKIKNLIRKPQDTLSQLHRRYIEMHNWIDVSKQYVKK